MKTLPAKGVKSGCDWLIDLARTDPVVVVEHGRPDVVVMPVEEFERMQTQDAPVTAKAAKREAMEYHGAMTIEINAARQRF